MFKKKPAYVELEAQTPSQPVKIAGSELTNGQPLNFKLTQRVEVEHVVINRGRDGLEVMLGTDDGHFIKVKITG
jgi:hypothetical protein